MKTVIVNAHVISPDVDLKNATIVIEGKKIKSVTSGKVSRLPSQVSSPPRRPSSPAIRSST